MRRTLVILGLCVALGACSSSDGSSGSAASDTSAVSTSPAATSPVADTAGTETTVASAPDATTAPDGTTPAIPPGDVDPCAIVTTDDVAAAFGGTVAAGVVNPDNGGCDYEITGTTNTGDSGVLTQVSIEFTGDYQSFEHAKVVFPDIEKVDGLGNEAWYYSFGSQLHVNLGGQEMVISGLLPGDDAAVKAEVIAFGRTVTGKL
jgi:hypothetical protein